MRTHYRLTPWLATLLMAFIWPITVAGQVHIIDLTTQGVSVEHNGATFIQGHFLPGGTGNLHPFFQVKSASTPIVDGYNTDYRPIEAEFETVKSGEGEAKALLLSQVPQIEDAQGHVWRELVLDINQTSGSRYLVLNRLHVWLRHTNLAHAYDPDGMTWGDGYEGEHLVYDLDAGPDAELTGPAAVRFNYDLEAGSGKVDMAVRIPDEYFEGEEPGGGPAADWMCDYGQAGCPCYVYVYAEFGDVSECPAGTTCNANDDGFEEWAITVHPFIQVSKTISGTVTDEYGWTIDKRVVGLSECEAFVGDSCEFDYEVEVTRSTTRTAYAVGGHVVYSVPSDIPGTDTPASSATFHVLSDDFAGTGGEVAWGDPTCEPGWGDLTLGPGSSKTCTFTVTYTDPDDVPVGTGVLENSVTAEVVSTLADYTATALGDVVQTTSGYADVDVDDTMHGAVAANTTGGTFTYSEPQTCAMTGYDGGYRQDDYPNTATIVETGQEASALVTMNCIAPTISKTGAGTYTRTYEWEITKTVDGGASASYSAFVGDSVEPPYEVTVTRTGFEDTDIVVNGAITVYNMSTEHVMPVTVVDPALDDGATVELDCGGGWGDATLDVPVRASGSFVPGEASCDFRATYPDGVVPNPTANVAVAVLNTYEATSPSAPIAFTEAVTNFEEVDVTDTHKDSTEPWTSSGGSGAWTYDGDFLCALDGDYGEDGKYTLTYPNTAEIVDTGQQASASVTIDCYAPLITKVGAGTYTRTYEWEISKLVNGKAAESYDAFAGQTVNPPYEVAVDRIGFEDSDILVNGTITVFNPNPDAAMTGVGVVDLALDDGTTITLDCGGTVDVPAAGSAPCTYSASYAPGLVPAGATNTAQAVFHGYTKTSDPAAIAFTETQTIFDEVNVTDTHKDATDPWGPVSGMSDWEYDGIFTCSDDPADYEGDGTYQITYHNTAEITETGQTASADVTIDCWGPLVDKTASTALTRTWQWTIDKAVDPESWDLFRGDRGESQWTISVVKTGYVDSGWGVTGAISVHNPAPMAMPVILSDALSTGEPASINCVDVGPPPTPDPVLIGAGSTLECTYVVSGLPSAAPRTNTVTAALNWIPFTDVANVDFSGATVTDIDETVTVNDLNGTTCQFSDTGWCSYTEWFECDADEGSHPNTATMYGDDTGEMLGTADAEAIVNCHELTIVKAVEETCFDRDWNWTLNKAATEGALTEPVAIDLDHLITLTVSQPYQGVQYDVTIGATSVDDEFRASGTITIGNPNTHRDALLTGVNDVISPAIAASVICPTLVVPAGGSLVCTWSATLPDGASRENQAEATHQNYSYGYEAAPQTFGTTTYAAVPVPVEFDMDTPCVETDECAVWADTFFGDDPGTPQLEAPSPEFCANLSAPLPQPTYPAEILRPGFEPSVPTALELNTECGMNVFPNIASLQITGEDGLDDPILHAPWFVAANVECDIGCTLTQGYWKTHNESFHSDHNGRGPMPDLVWWTLDDDYLGYDGGGNLVVMDGAANGTDPDQGDPFFLSGQSWYEVFWTTPKGGNAYYILAHQWMAAHLNMLAGASPEAAQAAYDAGMALLAAYTPEEVAALKGQAGKTLRNQFIDAAGVLGSYNEGLIGPGHCDDNGYLGGVVLATVEAAIALEQASEVAEAQETEGKGEPVVKTTAEEGAAVEAVASEAPVEASQVEIPTEFAVGNYPNPFNPTTTIQVAIPEASHVRVAVYDVLGRLVSLVLDGQLSAGTHSVSFDGGSLPSGVYLYRFEYDGGAITRTMQLLK